MNFWKHTTASPSLLDLIFRNTVPTFLRPYRADFPDQARGKYRIANIQDSELIASFWKKHYKGSDWYLDADVGFVEKYFSDSLILLLFDDASELLGTIASVPLKHSVYMSHGAKLNNVRIIEGLCIRETNRGQSYAGLLIQLADYFTSESPTVHLWSREVPSIFPINTAIHTATYAYIYCASATLYVKPQKVPWNEFEHFWTDYSLAWLKNGPCIVSMPYNRRGDLDVWVYSDATTIIPVYIVIANTRRRLQSNALPIYEVVWCGNQTGPGCHKDIKYILESVSAHYDGVMFASSAKTGGEAQQYWDAPWSYGTSGMHTWYIYNYLPPAFGCVDLNIVREEI